MTENHTILQSKYPSIKKIKWQKKGKKDIIHHIFMRAKKIISCEKHRQYFDLAVLYIYIYVCMYVYHDFLRECKPCYFLSFTLIGYNPCLLLPANYT